MCPHESFIEAGGERINEAAWKHPRETSSQRMGRRQDVCVCVCKCEGERDVWDEESNYREQEELDFKCQRCTVCRELMIWIK